MSWVTQARLAPPEPGRRAGRDQALEGLRGVCACLVLYAHLTIPGRHLDPAFVPPTLLWWFNLGGFAVLFFFVLSGYVIGLTTREAATGAGVRRYLGRRIVRLVPVNAAAVLVAWAFWPRTPVHVVAGNLAFLQNFIPYPLGVSIPVMPDNLNLWSLNFEALYYLGFIAVWWLAPRASWVAILLVGVAGLSSSLPGSHFMASSYAIGGLYWLAGLGAAWILAPSKRPGDWPSALLVVLVMWSLAPAEHLLFRIGVPDLVAPLPIPALHRIDELPMCLWLLLAVTGRGDAIRGRLSLLCLAMASVGFLARVGGGSDMATGALFLYGAALAAAWVLRGWSPRVSALSALAPLGSISFGIYALAFPIQFAVLRAGWLPNGTAWSYALRFALAACLTLGMAWILERKVQPGIRRRLGVGAS